MNLGIEASRQDPQTSQTCYRIKRKNNLKKVRFEGINRKNEDKS